jgi:hypothetical protein
MTHDELLGLIDAFIMANEDGDRCDCSSCPAFNALHAVVELHKPEPLDERGDVCLTCCPDLLTLYPCSTIQAIEKHLN